MYTISPVIEVCSTADVSLLLAYTSILRGTYIQSRAANEMFSNTSLVRDIMFYRFGVTGRDRKHAFNSRS